MQEVPSGVQGTLSSVDIHCPVAGNQDEVNLSGISSVRLLAVANRGLASYRAHSRRGWLKCQTRNRLPVSGANALAGEAPGAGRKPSVNNDVETRLGDSDRTGSALGAGGVPWSVTSKNKLLDAPLAVTATGW